VPPDESRATRPLFIQTRFQRPSVLLRFSAIAVPIFSARLPLRVTCPQAASGPTQTRTAVKNRPSFNAAGDGREKRAKIAAKNSSCMLFNAIRHS